MRTSKPCSTISYNSAEFLERKLNELVTRGFVDFWAFAEHLPEEDEEKKHKHLYIFPSKLLDTNQLRDELKEYDPTNPLKPLGCMPFQSSKFADWYLYVLHDSGYLSSKGQSRQYHYTDKDIINSDADFFNELRHTIDWSKINQLGQVVQAAQSGMSFGEFVRSGNLSLLSVRAAQFVFEQVQSPQGSLDRSDRSTHTPKTPKIDAETGEIL